MKSREPTIKDIARELNISPSTVSRALKNHPDISQQTVALVKEVAKRLDYHPNSIALSLRKNQTFSIGVIIPQIVHFFFSTVISGIEEVAYENGYNILLCQSDERLEKEINDTRALARSRVDGMLVSCSRETADYRHFQEVCDHGTPLVFFDRIVDSLATSQVITSDYLGARKAVQHLIDCGYKRIAHLAGPAGLDIGKNRLEGYKDALKENGITFEETLVCYDPQRLDYEGGYIRTKELLQLPTPPDAIFAHQDLNAIGAIKAIKEHGLAIPRDFGVVGFSNWQMAQYTDPPLTTIDQKGFEMGKEAARLLLAQIEHKEKDGLFQTRKVTLDAELVIRGTTRMSAPVRQG